ncbi:MAG: nucleotidyltransferase domain-containing protein [Chloroflexaceae bacterium]|jgi:predicted nucleotidyltransferase|nr:nucleotidyltransferase domain-containing protein [Chloroflexaceae bacterium]
MIHLHQPTAVPAVNATLSNVISIIEAHMPRQVRGYYLVGSYAVGEAVPASDLDVVVLFRDSLSADEQQQFHALRAHCKGASAYPLDLSAESEPKLRRVGGVWFQTASRWLYGEDIRAEIPRKPVAAHLGDLMHGTHGLLARVRGNPPALALPLDYPDPNGHFYGYDQRQIADGHTMRSVGTKDMVSNTLAIANVLTLQASGCYVGSGKKSDIPTQYQHWIGDQWTELIMGAYHTCRNAWNYDVPAEPAARTHLRRLCEELLAFEHRFLTVYHSEYTQ